MTGRPGDLIASEWTVGPIEHREAATFIREHHYSRSSSNTGRAHGLLSVQDDSIWGAVIWLPPTRRAAEAVAGDQWRGVLACSRLAVRPDAPRNAASFLLAASMRLLDRDRWPVLLTYADTAQGHTGAIYKATGWTSDGHVPAGDTWTGPNGEQRGRKRGGRNLTAEEMRAAGFTRNPRLPKIRFTHRAAA